jgi:hypothetical protein
MIALDESLQPLRRAALLVHAMPETDARWLLDTLADGQRAMLEPLLRELRALRLPADGSLLASLHGAPAAAAPVANDCALATIERQGIASLERLLAAEPAGVAVRFLGLRAWPWRLQVGQRLRIPPGPIEANGATGPALREALLQAIEQQLAQAPGQEPEPVRWWSAVRRRVAARSAP